MKVTLYHSCSDALWVLIIQWLFLLTFLTKITTKLWNIAWESHNGQAVFSNSVIFAFIQKFTDCFLQTHFLTERHKTVNQNNSDKIKLFFN